MPTRRNNRKIGAGAFALALFAFAAFFAFQRLRPQDPFQAAAVSNPIFPSVTYGIQAFLWWDEGHVGKHLDWVRMIEFNTVKQNFAWRDLESQPGVWDFSQSDRILGEVERRGLKLVARLGQVPDWMLPDGLSSSEHTDAPPTDLNAWASYCATIASRYPGRIHAYQIWNEPNLSREWGNREPNAAEYVEVLAACAQAIRAADPQAILISAGLAPTGNHDAIAHRDDLYLDALYQAGFQRYIDVVGAHAPGFAPPSIGPDQTGAEGQPGRWASFRRIEDLRKIMIEHGDAARQIAILEFGWTTDPVNPDYSWYAVDEETQAQYIRQAYAYAVEHWRPWVGLMVLIYLPKPTWDENDEEYWWSVALPNGFVRPAFYEIARMPKYCGDFIIPERAPDDPEFRGDVPTSPCP